MLPHNDFINIIIIVGSIEELIKQSQAKLHQDKNLINVAGKLFHSFAVMVSKFYRLPAATPIDPREIRGRA